MSKTRTKHKFISDICDAVILCLLLCGFGVLFVTVPMQEYGDSFQYVTHMTVRDPAYSLLIQLLIAVFGDYLVPLSFIQNALAVICIYYSYARIKDIYDLKPLARMLSVIALLSPHIITPLVSGTHMVITCSILTEGVALSLYYVWAVMMLSLITGYYGDKNIKALAGSLVLSVILAMIRGQFILCIGIWLVAVIYVSCTKGQYKKIFICILAVATCVAAKGYLTKLYHYAYSGVFTNTVSSAPMLLSNIVYIAEEGDDAHISDDVLRGAFDRMYEKSREKGLTAEFASGSIIDRARFHESGHEVINFEYVTEEIDEIIYILNGIDEENYNYFVVVREGYANDIIRVLLPHMVGRYILNTLTVSSLGFVRSVAIDKGPLVAYAMLIYAIALMLTIYLLRKNHRSRAAYMMLLVLVLICGTVFGTSLMIECISRYMIYNLPLFYIALMAELYEFMVYLKE